MPLFLLADLILPGANLYLKKPVKVYSLIYCLLASGYSVCIIALQRRRR